MARKTDIGLFILFLIVPYLALLLIGLLLIGETKWIFLVLALIPMLLILLGVLTRFSRLAQRHQRFFEIYQHMTETERKHFNKLNLRFMVMFWLMLGMSEAFVLILPHHFPGYWLGLAIMYLVMLPVLICQQKTLNRLLFSTQYARSKGWEKF